MLGVSGMLGNAIFRQLSRQNLNVSGVMRSSVSLDFFSEEEKNRIHVVKDLISEGAIQDLFATLNPDVVINCIGVIKQSDELTSVRSTLMVNSIFPLILADASQAVECKVVHFSTDCIFSGATGFYSEHAVEFAHDVYGVSKRLGELTIPAALTLRTSIIGHEIATERSLIDWFLSQQGAVKGFKNAIFSGLPTSYIGALLAGWILREELPSGLFHLSAAPISKFDLLQKVAKVYNHDIEIDADYDLKINRSLDSSMLMSLQTWQPPGWDELLENMFSDYVEVIERRRVLNA